MSVLLLATSVVLIAYALVHGRRARAITRPQNGEPRRKGALLLGLLQRVRLILPGLVGALSRRDSLRLLERAGLDARVGTRDVAAARAACLLLALLAAPRMIAAFPPRMLLLVAPACLWASAELPLFLLARRGAKRGVALRAALPDALDLLRACLAAGLPLRRSLSLVAKHCAEPLAGELSAFSTATSFGVPQSTALEEFARRNPEHEVLALVAAIEQAARGGSPLAPVVAAQAKDARLAHNRAIVERGGRAGPKIQLIVSGLIVPGSLIAFAAVVIAAIARGEIKML